MSSRLKQISRCVSPNAAKRNFANHGLENPETFRQFVLVPLSAAVIQDDSPGQRRSKFRVRLLVSAGVSAFLSHVRIVAKTRAQPKMFWVHARRIISTRAVVKNAQIVRDWTPVKYPTEPMRPNKLPLATPGCEPAVTFFGFRSSPKPAARRYLNVIPKVKDGSQSVDFLGAKEFKGEQLLAERFLEKFHARNQVSGYATPRAVLAALGHFILVSLHRGVN